MVAQLWTTLKRLYEASLAQEEENETVKSKEDREDDFHDFTTVSDIQKRLFSLKKTMSRYNDVIELKEREIIYYLEQKDQLMRDIEAVLDKLDLTFEERLVSWACLCHGKDVLNEIQKPIKMDPELFKIVLRRLKNRGLIDEDVNGLEEKESF